jgi:hypothetical protein
VRSDELIRRIPIKRIPTPSRLRHLTALSMSSHTAILFGSEFRTAVAGFRCA